MSKPYLQVAFFYCRQRIVYELLIRKNMTVKDLKKRLENLDDDQMVIITDREGWCNIEKIEVKGEEVHMVQETEPIFSD